MGHSGRGSKTYNAWHSMRRRCLGKNHPRHDRYKHFKICKRWSNFKNFLDDMGMCPEGKTLDRTDNKRGYNKKNCQWATPREQAQNRHNSIFVTYRGVRKSLADWARVKKIQYGTLQKRYYQGIRPPLLLSKKRIPLSGWIRSRSRNRLVSRPAATRSVDRTPREDLRRQSR